MSSNLKTNRQTHKPNEFSQSQTFKYPHAKQIYYLSLNSKH